MKIISYAFERSWPAIVVVAFSILAIVLVFVCPAECETNHDVIASSISLVKWVTIVFIVGQILRELIIKIAPAEGSPVERGDRVE